MSAADRTCELHNWFGCLPCPTCTATSAADARIYELVAERDSLRAEVERLAAAAELAVTATLEVLPLEGDWENGYRLSATLLQAEVRALPEEWGEAAYAVARLQRLVAAREALTETSGAG